MSNIDYSNLSDFEWKGIVGTRIKPMKLQAFVVMLLKLVLFHKGIIVNSVFLGGHDKILGTSI